MAAETLRVCLRHPADRNNIFGMPPPPGIRVAPDARPAARGGRGATGGWTMARRAGSALAAVCALAAVAAPVLLLGVGAEPAAAGTTGASGVASQSPVSVEITGMTPQEAGPRSTITVTGVLTNTSQQQISHLSVQLLSSGVPITSSAELQPAAAELDGIASMPLTGASWPMSGELQPRASASWSIRFKASAIGMTTFGVYPVAAQAESTLLQVPLATAMTYLPYVPSRKGPDASTIPARAKISWVWPLMDAPLLGEPWQNVCTNPKAADLARSLGSTGRLGQLLAAPAGGSGELTWAVDPALLADVQALASCRHSQPQWAKAARAWLAEFRRVSKSQPLFLTAYADPNVSALISAGHAADVRRAFQLGRAVGGKILDRDMSPSVSASGADDATGIAWPADGIAGYPTVENLAAADGIRTLLLSGSSSSDSGPTVTRVLNSLGGYMTVVQADQTITSILGSGGSKPSSAFGTAQEYLAQTALLAQQDPGQPIVVAPPRRWTPATGLPADVLADTAAAPWLSSASLDSLTTGKHVATGNLPATTGTHHHLRKAELRQLSQVDQEIGQLETIKATPDLQEYLAVAVIESSAWQGSSKSAAMAMLAKVRARIASLEAAVQIVAGTRVTLGGLKGSVPISIDNRLSTAVQVRLKLQFSQSSDVKITEDPGGLITVPAHTAQTVRLKVQATKVGTTAITLSLQNRNYQALSATPRRMTVQATQVGVLGVIIFAVALGVLLIAYGARAARGGRRAAQDATAPGEAGDQGAEAPTGPDAAAERSERGAEPDTVMAERTDS